MQVERLSKAIITLKSNGRKAQKIEVAVYNWLRFIPKNLFKSIIFDRRKIIFCDQNDMFIYFADIGTSSQRTLKEQFN